MANHSKLIAIISQHWAEIIGIVNEKLDIINLVASVKLGQKSSRRLVRCGRIEAYMENFVSIGIQRSRTVRIAVHGGGESFPQPQVDPPKPSISAVDRLSEPNCEWRHDFDCPQTVRDAYLPLVIIYKINGIRSLLQSPTAELYLPSRMTSRSTRYAR